MESRTTVVGGIEMRWEEAGEGIALVLLHGIPTSPRLWRHVVPRIAGARCLAWEMVGYGDSIPQGSERDISVGRQADYLTSWLDSLGVETAVLAGHDLGGGIAQIVAVRRPDLCAGLFLTNAISYDSWPIPAAKMMRAAGPIVENLPDRMFEKIFATFLERSHDNLQQATEAFDTHWPAYARHGGAAAFLRQVRSLDVQDTLAIADRLGGLEVAARIVWGAADPFQKLHYGERLADNLRAPLRPIEGGRHFTPEDHPDIVAEEISRLVSHVGSAGGRAAMGGKAADAGPPPGRPVASSESAG